MLIVEALLHGVLLCWQFAFAVLTLLCPECFVEIVVSTEVLQSRCGSWWRANSLSCCSDFNFPTSFLKTLQLIYMNFVALIWQRATKIRTSYSSLFCNSSHEPCFHTCYFYARPEDILCQELCSIRCLPCCEFLNSAQCCNKQLISKLINLQTLKFQRGSESRKD